MGLTQLATARRTMSFIMQCLRTKKTMVDDVGNKTRETTSRQWKFRCSFEALYDKKEGMKQFHSILDHANLKAFELSLSLSLFSFLVNYYEFKLNKKNITKQKIKLRFSNF